MNESEIRTRVVGVIRSIAPEVEEGELRDDRPLRDQVDLDSMDWLNVLVAVHEKLRVDIPEADYRKLVTLNDIVAYIGAKLASRV
ncbi:MAG TPA: acyl carrier protein [Burkholderiales bacterium]|nr:acyl carrier protein [Burkholderiales bacterium]